MKSLNEIGAGAKQAASRLAVSSGEARKRALEAMACSLENHRAGILEVNHQDVDSAKAGGLTGALGDRLILT
ncbi:MAG: gamma-glutamyl-phosphate reductase, partial [Actinomycetota bacterium]